MTTHHEFTNTILEILEDEFLDNAEEVFKNSDLIQYINIKTRSASTGSKARASFGNHYAIYVLVEDYVNRGFHTNSEYASYEGARFSDLLRRQRQLPFGSKLQNHALNHRLNQEFRKYFPTSDYLPILRDSQTSRYWINENLLTVAVDELTYMIAPAILRIIDAYVAMKQDAFESFIRACERLHTIQSDRPEAAQNFIVDLLRPNIDARIFEIVSYAILKPYYGDKLVYWGWSQDDINEEALVLYKTGRTNANDGGIDFVMRPLGRFFQVTESIDFRKYFLDIDKVQRYPITFVIKSNDPVDLVEDKIRTQALRSYSIVAIVDRYMDSIEELINIPILVERLGQVISNGNLENIVSELVIQSRVEFNLPIE